MDYYDYMGNLAPEISMEGGICLGLIRAGSDHGYAIAAHFEAEGDIGSVHTLTRPAVYRELQYLEGDGLIIATDARGARGQAKRKLKLSKKGNAILDDWLHSPVQHLRHMRNEFLAKILLLQMLEEDFLSLVRKQRMQFAEMFAALLDDKDQSVVALWRREQVRAASRFLDECEGSTASRIEPDIGEEMILSARNQLRGAVVSVKHGGVLSSVKVELAPGQVMTSTVTREAVDQLQLSPGSEVTALCKATDVMLAIHRRQS